MDKLLRPRAVERGTDTYRRVGGGGGHDKRVAAIVVLMPLSPYQVVRGRTTLVSGTTTPHGLAHTPGKSSETDVALLSGDQPRNQERQFWARAHHVDGT